MLTSLTKHFGFNPRCFFILGSICTLLFYATMKMAPQVQHKLNKPIRVSDSSTVRYASDMSPDSCGNLLVDGQFHYCDNQHVSNFSRKECWKPDGCDLHLYSSREIQQCLNSISAEEKTLIMMGDSRIREIYEKLVKLAFGGAVKNPTHRLGIKHYHNTTKTDFLFVVQPYLNDNTVETIRTLQTNSINPVLFVVGIALHMIQVRIGSTEKLNKFKTSLEKAKPYLDAMGKEMVVLWMVQPPTSLVLKAHIRDVYVRSYNEAAIKILGGTSVRVWHSARKIGKDSLKFYRDGVHLGAFANENDAQILINAICNRRMNFTSGVCCV